MAIITPPSIDRFVLKLCRQLGLNGNPLYVPVIPEPGAEIDECFPNVDAVVGAKGGEKIHGWTLWLRPNILIEAEFHAVWRSPEGELKDVTPKVHNEDFILFIADPVRKYNGVQVDNIRVPLRDSLVIRDFIRTFQAKYAVMNRGELAGKHGYVNVPKDEILPLYELGSMLEYMLDNGLKENDPCPCNSGAKYKRCHSRVVDDVLNGMR